MNSPLEIYLDELGKGLKPLPIHERLEQIDEARAHLEGLTESYRELGHEELESQVRAVAQFGDVKTVARELSRAVRKQNLWHAAGVAAIFSAVQNVIWTPFGMLLTFTNLHQYMAEIILGSGIVANLIAGVVLRRLVPGNTLRPLLLLSAVYLLLFLINLLRFWLQLGAVGNAIAPQGIVFAFLTSGALQELRYALRRRRILA
ncbi:HAAS signaling domain-containing protein [Armatimonas rosea]|uniref:Putative membrane protein n=1 Tax=Armatimonas rosea TaxID=685828 RepID=A0A7W9SM00_ARMRO|nr:hypothetical protein [Armatimonas rosea]MBB6049107.1 putative membrane protein [Armatimonas rosea]